MRLWADHQVKSKTYGVKRINHAVAGELVLPYETLGAAGDPDQCLVVYTPEPGSESAGRVALLASRSAAPRLSRRAGRAHECVAGTAAPPVAQGRDDGGPREGHGPGQGRSPRPGDDGGPGAAP